MILKRNALVFVLLAASLILTGCDGGGQSINSDAKASSSLKADTIEVVHFHATQQCWSCITVGKYALQTIQERFPKEYKNGTIVFRDINGELPENGDIVVRYQARGSSLFVNVITDDIDHIEEDVRVWRLITDEQAFMDYFAGKLKEFLR